VSANNYCEKFVNYIFKVTGYTFGGKCFNYYFII